MICPDIHPYRSSSRRPPHARSRRVRRLGAPARARAGPGRRHRPRDDPGRRQRLVARGGRGRTGRGLRVPARRRHRAASRSAVAAAARRRARPLAHLRPARPTSGATARGPAGRSAGGVVYELHVGTFTPEGTLDAAIGRLGHLVRLGVDFVELLPVNAFNGTHNWGYDGVLWYAVQETYGGPAAYQRFVDACHQQGLGVIQDVVYNHLGPSGNYLPRVLPDLRRGRRQHLGQLDQPLGARLRRGAPLRHRQRADVAARHARRRAAARRRARAGRRAGHARPGGDGPGGRQAVGQRGPAAVADRRERPQRPAHGHPAGGRRHGPDRAVERRLPPRPARDADRRGPGLLRRLRRGRARRAWPRR